MALDALSTSSLAGGGTLSNNSPIITASGSTTLAQDQARAANQGKPGYTVLGDKITGNTSAEDAQITANQNAAAKLGISIPGVGGGNQSTTTLSSNKTGDINNIQTTTNGLASNNGLTTTTDANGNQVSTYADNTPYTPGADNSPVAAPANGISNGGYVGETYYPVGATLPKDSTGNYASITPYSPTDVQNINNIAQLKSQVDSLTAATISNIQASYQRLIQQQQQANTANTAGETALLLRNGGLQNTGSGSNVVAATVSYGISQLADLSNKMQSAVIAAQTAGQNQDFQLQDKLNKVATDAQANMRAVAQKMQDDITAANNKIADQQFQTKQATTAAINNILTDATKNGADPATLAAIGKATTVQEALTAAAGNLQTMSGDFADYPQYKKDAIANGLVPLSATDWLAKKQTQDAKNKASEAYGTAFATAKGKAAGEAASSTTVPISPVTSSTGVTSGLVFNAPASIAPYVNFSSNGVKYVDMSGFAGTPTEKNQAIQDAQNAGYKVITNKNTAADVQNISNAKLNIQSIKDAFDPLATDNATARDTYQAALNAGLKALQANPNMSAADVFQDSALDIFKAISGIQGFRGGASAVQQVKNTFPQVTDTKAVVDQKIANLNTMLDNRETVLVGKPNASDQSLIDAKNAKNLSTGDLISNINGGITQTQSPTDFWNSLTPTIR